MQLVRTLLFVLIQLVNFGIFRVAWDYVEIDGNESFLHDKWHLLTYAVFQPSLVIHGLSASISLLLVSLLVCFRFEQYAAHRLLGKISLLLILGLTVPSGIVLSFFASGGPLGKFLFVLLSFYTAWAVIQGYLAIRKHAISSHKQWMIELLVLLCSALILRLLIVLFVGVFQWRGEAMYLTAVIGSWLPWIGALKWIYSRKRPVK